MVNLIVQVSKELKGELRTLSCKTGLSMSALIRLLLPSQLVKVNDIIDREGVEGLLFAVPYIKESNKVIMTKFNIPSNGTDPSKTSGEIT